MRLFISECKTCGEPSEGRTCPVCRDAANKFNGRVRRQENEEWNGSSNEATVTAAR
jgi:hypothetical protein